MPIPLTTPLTSKSKRVAIGAGSSERRGAYFGRLISLGEAITSGPTIVGDESGGTEVGEAAAAAGELPAAGAALAGAVLGVPGAVPPELSAHALFSHAITRVRSSTHTRPLTVEPRA